MANRMTLRLWGWVGLQNSSLIFHCCKKSFRFSDGRRSSIFLHAQLMAAQLWKQAHLMVGPSGDGSFWVDILFLIIKLFRAGC